MAEFCGAAISTLARKVLSGSKKSSAKGVKVLAASIPYQGGTMGQIERK
jgi:hypothetical protein